MIDREIKSSVTGRNETKKESSCTGVLLARAEECIRKQNVNAGNDPTLMQKEHDRLKHFAAIIVYTPEPWPVPSEQAERMIAVAKVLVAQIENGVGLGSSLDVEPFQLAIELYKLAGNDPENKEMADQALPDIVNAADNMPLASCLVNLNYALSHSECIYSASRKMDAANLKETLVDAFLRNASRVKDPAAKAWQLNGVRNYANERQMRQIQEARKTECGSPETFGPI